MLKKALTWAAENDVEIKFQKNDDGLVAVIRKGIICSAFALIDNTGEIAPNAYSFIQTYLSPAIEAIMIEHLRNPEPEPEDEHE